MTMVAVLFPLLIYPGALWCLLVAAILLAGFGGGERRRGGWRQAWRALHGRGSLPHALAIIFALIAISLLPWPQSPIGALPAWDVWRVWAWTEASCLAALLPGLASSLPAMSRAAVREAQIGVSGRAMLWIALLVGYRWNGTTPLELGVLLLAALVALLALPAAAGWQPFGGEGGLGLGESDAYLAPEDVPLARLARDLRGVLLALLVATLFIAAPHFSWWQQLMLKLWLAFAIVLVGRSLQSSTVRRSLPLALRFCWRLVLPLALLALAARLWLAG